MFLFVFAVVIALLFVSSTLKESYTNGHRITHWLENSLPSDYPYTTANFAEMHIAFGILTAYREQGESLRSKLAWINHYLKSTFPNLKHQVIESYEGARVNGLNMNQMVRWVKFKVPEKEKIQLTEFIIRLASSNNDLNAKELQFIYVLMTNWKVDLHDLDESVQSLFLGDRTNIVERENRNPNAFFYTVLGLEPDATAAEIKKAYRTLVKKYHPDSFHFLTEEEKKSRQIRFLEIQKAYEVLQSIRSVNNL